MRTNSANRWLAVNFSATIFVSAFLLFQVQPLVSKCILPWFGGTPAVWTTCMLFFQTLLFAGYAYAHFSAQRLQPKMQAMVHLVLIVLGLVCLRVIPGDAWKPPDSSYPALRILALLTATVGLPYFVLSSTGPLIQAWFARSFENRVPYRLYALSNVGSLLALLSYPFFFERKFDLKDQATIWMVGFVAYAALCGYAAVSLWMAFGQGAGGRAQGAENAEGSRQKAEVPTEPRPLGSGKPEVGSRKAGGGESALPIVHPTLLRRLLWIILPAFASVVLLATTNHICADISVSPLLWILPLSLYLITFIVAFDHPRWYRPNWTAGVTILAIYIVALVYNAKHSEVVLYESGTAGEIVGKVANMMMPAKKTKKVDQADQEEPASTPPKSPKIFVDFKWNLALNCLAMLGICLMCHGELVRLRPHPQFLTGFYLMIAAGGALGGLAVSLIAPNVFQTFAEWNLSLLGGYLLAVGLIIRSVWQSLQPVSPGSKVKRLSPIALIVATITMPIAGIGMYDLIGYLHPPEMVMRARNFFGTLAVMLEQDTDSVTNEKTDRDYLLQNGKITHGLQFIDREQRRIPTTYYASASGVGLTIGYYRQTLANRGVRIGAVGLGTGTLAAYVDKGDSICFYEINPKVREITTSGKWFTYLKDAEELGGHVEIKMGDARLTMERETAAGDPPRFDVLVLDAFSGDAIPVHLLTKEAMEIYLSHLSTVKNGGIDGAIAVHISNLHVDLEPVVLGIAQALDLEHVFISNPNNYSVEQYNSDWIVLTHNQQLVADLSQYANTPPEKENPPQPPVKPVLWTDSFSNLFEVLK